jgi:hypothetical protein
MRLEARSNLASSVVCADLDCRQASEEEEKLFRRRRRMQHLRKLRGFQTTTD